MRKLWAMIQKDVLLTFTDRMALLFNLAMPFVISMIIGLAFGTVSGGSDVTIANIKVVVVNQDAGTTLPTGGALNLGAQLADFFIDPPDATLNQLFDASASDDWDAARRSVETGEVVAAVHIPADFSAQATVRQQGIGVALGQGTIDLYHTSGAPISSSVVESVLTGWASRISTGSIATKVGIEESLRALSLRGVQVIPELTANLEAAYTAAPITVIAESAGGERQEFNILSFVAPSMAIFFLTFGATFAASSVLDEQRQWTLQRMIISPTPRAMILAGKMASTFITGVLQLVILLVATSLAGANWGSDPLAVALLILAVVSAATGLGALLASLFKRPEQVGTYGVAVLMVLGILAGSFVGSTAFLGDLEFLSALTLNYWGINGFNALATGGTLADIAPNLAALLLMGVVFFVIGVWRFNRRLDI